MIRSSEPTRLKSVLNSAPAMIPMNSELYASRVMSASAIAIIGGRSAIKVE
jgi:hypothetical protein